MTENTLGPSLMDFLSEAVPLEKRLNQTRSEAMGLFTLHDAGGEFMYCTAATSENRRQAVTYLKVTPVW